MTFSSGYTHAMTYRRFVIADVIAAAIWGTYAALLGYIGGKQFEEEPWKGLLIAFFVAISIAGLVELVRHRRERRRAGRRRDGPRRRRYVLAGRRARSAEPELAPRAREVPRAREQDHEREHAVQAVDPAARAPRCRRGRRAARRRGRGMRPRAPTAVQLPHHAQIAPITIRSCPMCTTIEKPPCASSAPSPGATHVRGDREGLNQHADDDDHAADEHEPQRCSSHARDHTTSTGRRKAARGVRTGREPPRRVRRARTSSSTPTIRSTGTRGGRRPSGAPAPRIGRCSSRSATARATGAT